MKIIAIAAVDEDWGIGKEGQLPWDHLEDRQYFKNVTMKCPCIMGRKTYEDLAQYFKKEILMPGRFPIVVSTTLVRGETVDFITPRRSTSSDRPATLVTELPPTSNSDYNMEDILHKYGSKKKIIRHSNVTVAETIDAAIMEATQIMQKSETGDAIYFIGGSSIYEHVINNEIADEVLLSHVPGKYNCDTFFPQGGMEMYEKRSSNISPATGIDYAIYTLKGANND